MGEHDMPENAAEIRNGQVTIKDILYLKKAISLYNKGEYEEALIRFEALSEDNPDANIVLIPHIYKCTRVTNTTLSVNDRYHYMNQAILKYFGWINSLKEFTKLLAIFFFILLIGSVLDKQQEDSPSSHYSISLALLIGAITSSIFSYILHRFMKRFNVSKGLVRCKYCGQYTYYINPNEQTENYCCNCRAKYPVPDFFWDSWKGFERIEDNHSIVSKIALQDYVILKEKYSKEYYLYKTNNLETYYLPYSYFHLIKTIVKGFVNRPKNRLKE